VSSIEGENLVDLAKSLRILFKPFQEVKVVVKERLSGEYTQLFWVVGTSESLVSRRYAIGVAQCDTRTCIGTNHTVREYEKKFINARVEIVMFRAKILLSKFFNEIFRAISRDVGRIVMLEFKYYDLFEAFNSHAYSLQLKSWELFFEASKMLPLEKIDVFNYVFNIVKKLGEKLYEVCRTYEILWGSLLDLENLEYLRNEEFELFEEGSQVILRRKLCSECECVELQSVDSFYAYTQSFGLRGLKLLFTNCSTSLDELVEFARKLSTKLLLLR